MCERRAYQLNADILQVADGSDFDRYLAAWPVDFTVTGAGPTQSASISFHDTTCPQPPAETLAHRMWQEGGASRQILQSIGRVTVLERLAGDLPPQLTNYLVGNLQTGG